MDGCSPDVWIKTSGLPPECVIDLEGENPTKVSISSLHVLQVQAEQHFNHMFCIYATHVVFKKRKEKKRCLETFIMWVAQHFIRETLIAGGGRTFPEHFQNSQYSQ